MMTGRDTNDMKLGFRCSEGSDNFQNALREVTYAEEQGLDSAWVAEHHGWDIIWPSSHMALAGLATRTESIELGTSVTLLPQANPVRLAGEVNLLDQISEGRFNLGVGVGWRESEMENLGYDFSERGARMTDHLKAMNALWEDDVATYDGEYVSFEGFELTPEPVQQPRPPIWVGGGVEQALKRAAYLGDSWFPVWLDTIDELEPMYSTFDDFVREAGGDPAERDRPILRVAWIDEDPDVACERLQEFFDRLVQNYRDRNATIPAAMQEAVNGDFEAFADGRLIYGDPEGCVERIKEFEDRLEIDHMVLKLYNPGVDHEQMMQFLELLGDGAVPHL